MSDTVAASVAAAQDEITKLHIASQFLAREARLLDEGREEEWLELLDDDLRYVIPVRQATENRADEVHPTGFRVRELKGHMRVRVDRLHTAAAYSEIPPSRCLRIVGSIELQESDDPNVIAVSSALLMYRQRGIDPHFDLIPARRDDRILLTEEGPKLLHRKVILTETSLATPNLGVFL